MKNMFFVLFLTLWSGAASAAWIEASGKITNMMTYATNNTILVTISSAGTPVDECSNNSSFAVSKSMDEEARSRMFAMLLAAKASGASVTIAYNDVGQCEPWGSNSSAYRKIQRLR